jgi:hypothetical protein
MRFHQATLEVDIISKNGIFIVRIWEKSVAWDYFPENTLSMVFHNATAKINT